MTFFRHPTEHSPPVVTPSDESNVQHGFALVKENLKAVFVAFTSQTSRPILRSIPACEVTTESPASTATAGSELPNIDEISPEDLVQNLDAMALATFRNVTQEVTTPLLAQMRSNVFLTGSVCYKRHLRSTDS